MIKFVSMRIINDMENIIFLGAGASKADGVPLQNEIFKEYFAMLELEDSKNMAVGFYDGLDDLFIPTFEKVKKNMRIFFHRYFGLKNINEDSIFPTFEEALGMVDLAITRKEKFFQHSATYNLDSLKYGEYEVIQLTLILAMAEIIGYKVKKSNGYTHIELIKNLGNRNNIAFISTNYDTLIDNAIINTGKKIDYGFYVTKDTVNNNSINLCKIHGSLNWLFCPVCKNIVTTGLESGVLNLLDMLIDAACPKCRSLMESVIVPPSFFKNYQNLYLSNIWYKAEQLLIDTKKIIFCGYSFPDADIYIKYLLKRAEMLNNNDISYYVVNNYFDKAEKDKKMESLRFERFFNKKNKVVYTDLSFQEFAKDPFTLLN